MSMSHKRRSPASPAPGRRDATHRPRSAAGDPAGLIALALFAGLTLAGCVTARDKAAPPAPPDTAAAINLGDFRLLNEKSPRSSGTMYDLAVRGDSLLAVTPLGLVAYDVTNPAAPRETGRAAYPDADAGLRIAYAGNHAYVGNGSWGMAIIDVSNPAAPKSAGSLRFEGRYIHAVASLGDRLAVITDGKDWQTGMFWVFDLADPARPRQLSMIEAPKKEWDWFAAAAGSRVFAVNRQSGLSVFDLSDPAAPRIAATLDLKARVKAFALRGSVGYAAVEDRPVLLAIDLSSPDSPRLAGEIPTGNESWSSASEIRIAGDLMYLAAGWSLEIKDISKPLAPVSLAVFRPAEFGGWTWHLAIAPKGIAYVSEGESRLHALDIASPGDPRWIGAVDLFDTARDVAVESGKAYVAAGYGLLDIYDVANPKEPRLIGRSERYGDQRANYARRHGRQILVDYGYKGTYVLDTQTGMETMLPVEGGSWETGMAFKGDLRVKPLGDRGAILEDFSKPGAPRLLGKIEGLGPVVDVAIDGDTAFFLANDHALVAVDIKNPAKPVLLSRLAFGSDAWCPGRIAAADGTVYVPATWEGTYVIDVKDPKNMKMGPRLRLGDRNDAFGASIAGRYLLVANGSFGIAVVDRETLLSRSFACPGKANSAILQDGKIYVAAGHAGLYVFGN